MSPGVPALPEISEQRRCDRVDGYLPEKPGDCLLPEGKILMRIAFAVAAALFGGALLAVPGAFADPARDNLLRAEAQIQALNPADANAAAAPDYQMAQLRLSEARAAEDKNKDAVSLWRSEEAAVQADVVQEKIKLHALQRTVSEIETGIGTLRRELNS